MKNDLVIKHNDLVEARYELNLVEQKIILYAVTKIDTSKDNFNIVHIKVNDLTELMESETPIRYSEFRIIANGLMDKKIYLKDKPKLDVRWASSSEYKGNGIIELEFSQKLVPYLLQLKEKFTRYQLKYILNLKSKYSVRIYELMKQYENIGKREFKLEELKKILYCEDMYSDFRNFNRVVLDTTKKEINEFTDIKIDYKRIKQGRKIVGLLFTIEPKNQQDKIYIKYLNEVYDVQLMKSKMGLSDENFSAEQIINLYELSIEKTQDEFNPFEYCRLNYLHVKNLKQVRNVYAYLCDSIAKDYAAARGQLSLLDSIPSQ